MNADYKDVIRKSIQSTAEQMAKECTYAELVACAASAKEDRDFSMMQVFNKAAQIQFEMAVDLMAISDGIEGEQGLGE